MLPDVVPCGTVTFGTGYQLRTVELAEVGGTVTKAKLSTLHIVFLTRHRVFLFYRRVTMHVVFVIVSLNKVDCTVHCTVRA